MKKVLIPSILAIALFLTVFAPAIATETPTQTSVSTSTSSATTAPLPTVTPTATPSPSDLLKLENLKLSLSIAQNELLLVYNRIQDEILKLGQSKNDSAKKITSLEKQLSDAIQKQKTSDEKQIKSLQEDKLKWETYVNNTKKSLQNEILKIQSNLAKTVAELKKKIESSKIESEKLKYGNLISIREKYAAQRISIIQGYILKLDEYWLQKQKEWDLKLSLINQRNNIDLAFANDLNANRINELKEYIQGNAGTTSDNQEKNTQKVNEKYEKTLNSLKAKIEKLKVDITNLSVKLGVKN